MNSMFIKHLCFLILTIIASSAVTIVHNPLMAESNFYGQYMVQSPTLAAPEKGSLTGVLSSYEPSVGSLTSGNFEISIPYSFPEKRAKLLFDLTPKYSPNKGFSEYGQGFGINLCINRFRSLGEVDYSDKDDFNGALGWLIKGSDGFYYPKGLRNKTRIEVANDGQTLIAYLSDGRVLQFGSDNIIAGSKGIYSWCLTKASDKINGFTNFTYERNKSGNLYLSKVEYGKNNSVQYQLNYEYNSSLLPSPFLDFRSGKSIEHDRLISRITTKVLDAKSNFYKRAYVFQFTYNIPTPGIRAYLEKFQKFFIGEKGEETAAPPITYKYKFDNLKAIPTSIWNVVTKYDGVLSGTILGMDAFSNRVSSFFDIDKDGLIDVEVKGKFSLIKQTENEAEATPLARASYDTPDAEGRKAYAACLDESKPRFILPIKGVGSPYNVLVVIYNQVAMKTAFVLCDRSGYKIEHTLVNEDWSLDRNAKLVDLNQDKKPDLIRSRNGYFEIYLNSSTKDKLSFSPVSGPIKIPVTDMLDRPINGIWVGDINGDGIADIFTLSGSIIQVWYGKSGLDFERTSKKIPIDEDGRTSRLNISNLNFIFEDVNRDGMTDMFLVGDRFISLFINQGDRFINVRPEALERPNYANISSPTTYDLSGTGNSQVSLIYNAKLYNIQLNSPESGLMTAANDGMGNAIEVQYERAKPVAGIIHRPIVVSKIKKHSTGVTSTSLDIAYNTPKNSALNEQLMGFEIVDLKDSNRIERHRYFYNDDTGEMEVGFSKKHPKVSSVTSYEDNSFEKSIFNGVPFYNLTKKEIGYSNDDGVKINHAVSFRYNQDGFCIIEEKDSMSEGTLKKSFGYFSSDEYLKHLSCLPTNISLSGQHKKGEYDFTHSLTLKRNEQGLLTELINGDNRSIQKVKYRSGDFLIDNILTMGRAKTIFTYDDSFRITSIINPEGKVTSVDDYYSAADLPSSLNLGSSNGSNFWKRFFSYDKEERLEKEWSNLYKSSEVAPISKYEYQYADGKNLANLVVESRLTSLNAVEIEAPFKEYSWFSGRGDLLIKASDLRSDGGDGYAITDLNEFLTNESTSKKYSSMNAGVLESKNISFDNLKSMYASSNLLSTDISSGEKNSFIGLLDSRKSYHQDVTSNKEWRYYVDSGLASEEYLNGKMISKTIKDLNGNLIDFTSGDASTYQYDYDLIGRLRKVTLPNGIIHKIVYDNYGDRVAIIRDQIGKILYSYDVISGDLVQKKIYDNKDEQVRTVSYQRDVLGRIIDASYVGIGENSDRSSQFQYSYDGKTGDVVVEGQLGKLSRVSNKDFTRTQVYTLDDLLQSEKIEFSNWNQISRKMSYLSNSKLKTLNLSLSNNSGNLIRNIDLQYNYNSSDKLVELKLNGTTSRSIMICTYNGLGDLQKIQLEDGSVYNITYDSFTNDKSGYQITLSAKKEIKEYDWRFNEEGRIGSELYSSNKGENGSEKIELNRSYQYSLQGFLLAATDNKNNYAYDYDLIGNMIGFTKNQNKSEIGYSLKSWNVTGQSNYAYQLNANGEVSNKNGLELKYNAQGKIAEIKKGNDKINYGYDEKGNILWKSKNGKIIESYWDLGGHETVVVKENTLLVPINIDGMLIGYLLNDKFIVVPSDLRKTPTRDIDKLLSPYGSGLESVINGNTDELASIAYYAGTGYDADLGAIRMGQRFYDSETGRFLSPDPLFLEAPEKCINSQVECGLYSYAGSNPVNNIDPSGEFLLPLFVAAVTAYSIYDWAKLEPVKGHEGDGITSTTSPIDWLIGAAAGKLARGASSATETVISRGLRSDVRQQMSHSGTLMDSADSSGRLSMAGRALQKHGSREGSVFPSVKGNPAELNKRGEAILNKILEHPDHTVKQGNRFGGIDVFTPDGAGARFDSNNKFKGFLEPPKESN